MTVEPAVFSLINYDADEIATIAGELAGLLGIGNPITIDVDETTPLSKVSASVEARSSDARITVSTESGALEDTQRFTNLGPAQARVSIGRMLLRARDRIRPDFTDAPPDLDLSLRQNAAWDAYCAGRLARIGVRVNEQRFRYNFRNRFGFADDVDAMFDRLWSADDLGWSAIDDPT
ncbi:MAG: hypothetical protein AAFP84_08785 [Actinomycetota bacterium]